MTRNAISIAAIALALTSLTVAAHAKPVHHGMSKANQVTAQLNQQQVQGTPLNAAGSEPGMTSAPAPGMPQGMTNDATAGTMNNDTSATSAAPLPPANTDQGANAYVTPDANAGTTSDTTGTEATPGTDTTTGTSTTTAPTETPATTPDTTTGSMSSSSSSSSGDATSPQPGPAIQ